MQIAAFLRFHNGNCKWLNNASPDATPELPENEGSRAGLNRSTGIGKRLLMTLI